MFSQIKPKELPTWVNVFTNEGETDAKVIFQELKLIDELLILQKSQSLLTRKRGLKTMLEARIAKELGHNTFNILNRKR